MNSRTFALAALSLLALLAVGCAGVGKPHGWASPEIDGSLYVSLERGHLSALDPETYEQQWEFPASDDFSCGSGGVERYDLEGIYEAPALGEDTLYFGAYDGAVYAVDREQATCKWRFDTDDPIVGGVVLTDDGLYVPSEDGFLYLLDPDDGSEVTRRQVGDIWATPLVTDNAVYVATIDGKLWKLEPGSLEPVWDVPFSVNAALLTPPTLVGNDTVLVGGIGKELYAIDTSDGSQKWSVGGKNWYWGRPLVDGETIYVTDLGGQVQKINADSGSVEADFTGENSIRGGVVQAGETLVAVDDAGNVYRLSADALELQGQPNELEETVRATPLVLAARNGTASPTPSDDEGPQVLISTEGGDLWVLDVTKGQLTQVVR